MSNEIVNGFTIRPPSSDDQQFSKQLCTEHLRTTSPLSRYTDDSLTHAALQELAYSYAAHRVHATIHSITEKHNKINFEQLRNYFIDFSNNNKLNDMYPAVIMDTGVLEESWVQPLVSGVMMDVYPVVLILRAEQADTLFTVRALIEWMLVELRNAAEIKAKMFFSLLEHLEMKNISLPEGLEAYRNLNGTRYSSQNGYPLSQYTQSELLELLHIEILSWTCPIDEYALFINRLEADNVSKKSFPLHQKLLCNSILNQLHADIRFCENDFEMLVVVYEEAIDRCKQYLQVTETLLNQNELKNDATEIFDTVASRSLSFDLILTLHSLLIGYIKFLQSRCDDQCNLSQHLNTTESDKQRLMELFVHANGQLRGFHARYLIALHAHSENITQPSRNSQFISQMLFLIEEIKSVERPVLNDFISIYADYRKENNSRDQMRRKRNGLAAYTHIHFLIGISNFPTLSESQYREGSISTSDPTLLQLAGLDAFTYLFVKVFALQKSFVSFERCIEALIADIEMPLQVSVEVLNWLCKAFRSELMCSIQRFVQTLNYLLFIHYRTVPWSFLGHLCSSTHWQYPLDYFETADWEKGMLSPSYNAKKYLIYSCSEKYNEIAKHHTQCLKAIRKQQEIPQLYEELIQKYLNLFSIEQKRQLATELCSECKDWEESEYAIMEYYLIGKLSQFRSSQSLWKCGWRCFRQLCYNLCIQLSGEDLFACLESALNGDLSYSRITKAESKRTQYILRKITDALQTCSILTLIKLFQELNDLLISSKIHVDRQIQEVSILCQYMQLAKSDNCTSLSAEQVSTALRMETKLRKEVHETIELTILQPFFTHATESLTDENIGSLYKLNVFDQVALLQYRVHPNQLHAIHTALTVQSDSSETLAVWKMDLCIVYAFYRQNASIFLQKSDWFRYFVSHTSNETLLKKDRMNRARFARAYSVLQYLGFVRDKTGKARSKSSRAEKLVFF